MGAARGGPVFAPWVTGFTLWQAHLRDRSRTDSARQARHAARAGRGQRINYAAVRTVRGWRHPIANTHTVLTVATAAIGVSASGKLPVSATIQPIR
jgi:hypothetical protein